MFDFVRKHTRLLQFLLLILIVPSFVVVGVEGYSRFMDGSNSAVATVGSQKITQTEWDAALRQQQERMRAQSPNVDPKLLDTPEVRKQVLEQVVRDRLLDAVVAAEHRGLSDVQINEIIRTDPQFAGFFDAKGNFRKEVLAGYGLTAEGLFQTVRQQRLLQQVLGPIATSGLPMEASTSAAFDAQLQQREVQVQRFDVKDFAAALKPTDADLEAYYKDPKVSAKFQLPETADIEYIALDQAALLAGAPVNAGDVEAYYKSNLARFSTEEERRASHILIASGADKAKAKAKAEEVLAEVRKNPAAFADLAKKYSDDKGSAEHGGDLDFFGRKAMVKPFEDAAFALKEGEVSGLVESDYGFHIIKLTGIRGGKPRPFEEVRADIESDLRKENAQKRYTELADDFSNTVEDQSDSLKAAADKFKLTIQKATVQRKPGVDQTGPLASSKLLDAVFGDALTNKRNTQAIETGPSQLVAAHVIAHHPARVPALADVKPAVTAGWVQQHALEAATKAGQARLAELQKDGDAKGLGEAIVVSRAKPGLPPKALEQVLRTDATKLPAFTGVDAGDGQYLVVRINKVLPRDPAVIDAKRASDMYSQIWSAAEMLSFYNAMKTEYKAVIKPSTLKSLTAAGAASAPAN